MGQKEREQWGNVMSVSRNKLHAVSYLPGFELRCYKSKTKSLGSVKLG